MFEKNKPITAIDWEKVKQFRVTLKSPYAPQGGGLRWRSGTSDSKKNLSYNAHDDSSGPPVWPGLPIMHPEEGPAVVGDADRESFIMDARIAFNCFGHFFAPLEVPKNGTIGFTMSSERERVAAYWGGYKMPKGDGTMHPPMARIGPPAVPDVELTPIGSNLKPIKLDGEEITIRVRDFFDFDNAGQYSVDSRADQESVAAGLGLSQDELDEIREIVKAQRGKRKAG